MGEGQPGKPGQPPGQGQPSGASQLGGAQPSAGPTELGSGFVPSSPQITAQRIAGPQASAQAADTLAAAANLPMPGSSQQTPSPDAGQTAQGNQPMGQGASQQPMAGPASPMAAKGGNAVAGESQNNQKPPPGELQLENAAQGDSRGQQANQDAELAKSKFAEEPWFARLPPKLQSAIQSKARGKAPRGYEERLRRYFESID